MRDVVFNAFVDEVSRLVGIEKTAGILDAAKTLFTGRMPLYASKLPESGGLLRTSLSKNLANEASSTGRALRMDIPRGHIQENAVLDPRLFHSNFDFPTNEMVNREIGGIALKGGAPMQYVRNSPNYQGVTLGELKNHFKNAVTNPRALMKDVARSAKEVSTNRPNFLRQLRMTNPDSPNLNYLPRPSITKTT